MTVTVSRLLACAALAGALMLGACGKQGELERPAPLFGAKAKAEYRAEKRREARARRAARQGQQEAEPAAKPTDYGQGDPSLDPMRAAPVPGAAPSPFDHSGGGGGVLPDPFSNPNAQPR